MFQSLKEKSVLYLLENSFKPQLKIAEVVNVKYPQSVGGQFGNICNEMNIVVRAEDGSVVNLESVPCFENIFTSKDQSLTVCDSRDVMAAHVAALNSECKRKIEAHEYNVSASAAYDDIEMRLNPQLAKEQERDAEINNLNRRMESIEMNITGIQAGISNLLEAINPKKK